jgi:hypothetical protein
VVVAVVETVESVVEVDLVATREYRHKPENESGHKHKHKPGIKPRHKAQPVRQIHSVKTVLFSKLALPPTVTPAVPPRVKEYRMEVV